MTDPSQPLTNARHERFAQLVAGHGETGRPMPLHHAYEAAGYSGRNSGVATKLAQREDVADRIAWLKQTTAERAGITVEEWLREQMQTACFDPRVLLSAMEAGTIDHLPANVARQITRYEVTEQVNEDGDVVSRKRKLWWRDGQKALDRIGEHIGATGNAAHWQQPRDGSVGRHDLKELTADELHRLRDQKLADRQQGAA